MSSSGRAAGATVGALSGLQPGVLLSGDLVPGTISINTSTGALTFTPASTGTYAFVQPASGALTAVAWTAAAQTITPALPATTKYAVVGVEITSAGAWQLVKGTDTATQLNTGTLIASNTPAVTSGNMRVADFAYWNNAGTINFGDHTTTATQGVNWIDRRPNARGAYARILRTQNASAGNNYTLSSASYAAIDATNIATRIECSGVPIRVRLQGVMSPGGATGQSAQFAPFIDGAQVETAAVYAFVLSTASFYPIALSWEFIPAAGSHLLVPYYQVSANSLTVYAESTFGLQWSVEEQVTGSFNNGTA